MAADSTSTSAFVTSLIFYGIIGLILFFIFVSIRYKDERFYEPRSCTDIQTIREEERTEKLPHGRFKWISILLFKPQSYILQETNLDGYLFLRFIGLAISISFIGCFLLFPILFPVNATNGENFKGFEILSLANVRNKQRLYAHVFLSWIFDGLLMFIIYKELYYYFVLRHAVQTTPLYDNIISSKTIIITNVDTNKLNEKGDMEKIFMNCKRIFYAKNTKELDELVEKRSKYCLDYEQVSNNLLKKCVKMKNKADKNSKYEKKLYEGGTKRVDNLETYVPFTKRPTKRVGYKNIFLKYFTGRKENTLQYYNEKIPELTDNIHKRQRDYENDQNYLKCAFLEFSTQLEAQMNFQKLSTILGKKNYDRKYIGLTQDDIHWSNLNMYSNMKLLKLKRVLGGIFLSLMIFFWAIPVAVVGLISNISFLTDKVYFFRFINNLPDFLLGLITGILPSLALSFLMSLVPPVIMKVSNLIGAVSKQETDLYCHKWFYLFQVLQVFLITTCTSSASSTVVAIIDDPSSAMTLLAKTLPKSSNFYINYFLLFALSVPPGMLLQLFGFLLTKLPFKFGNNTPRQKWTNYNTLMTPTYGVMYPTVEILLCIAISYSIVAPVILFFSTVSLIFLYFAYLYQLNYVMGFTCDLKGKNYILAVFHIFVPIYISEVSLIGLFIMDKSWGPMALEIFALVVTALVHIYFKQRFLPLIDCVPLSAIRYASGEKGYRYPKNDLGLKEMKDLNDEAKENLSLETSDSAIRPATRKELKHAHLLPTDGDISSMTSSEFEESSRNYLEEGSTKNEALKNQALDVQKQKGSSNESDHDKSLGHHFGDDDDKKEPIVQHLSNVNVESQENDPSRRRGSTFIDDELKFRKFDFTDIEDHAKTVDVTNFNSHDNAVMNEADAGHVFSDKDAVLKSNSAFPENVNRTHPWKRRIINFFQPKRSYPFNDVRMSLPHGMNMIIEYDKTFERHAYDDPSVTITDPIIWLASDPMGVSKQLVEEARINDIDITDDFAIIDEKAQCQFTFNPPDYEYPAKK